MDRHKNRKFPCLVLNNDGKNKNEGHNGNAQNDNENDHNRHQSDHDCHQNNNNCHLNDQNYQQNDQKNPYKNLTCVDCDKIFSNMSNLKRHMKTCKGIDNLQCDVCLKVFKNKKTKKNHLKNANCKPCQRMANIINNNNITNNNTTNNITNNTTNNYNIQLNFGKEDLTELCHEKEYLTRMEKNIRSGKYAIINSLKQIYFNDKYPYNKTLKKMNKNDALVHVHVNGEWEVRLLKDIFKPVNNKIENYHKTYFDLLQEKYEDIDDPKRLNNLLGNVKRFGKQMLWYDWSCTDIERIGFEFDQDEDQEEERKRKNDLLKLMKDKIYSESN
jgi:hypothetical protein